MPMEDPVVDYHLLVNNSSSVVSRGNLQQSHRNMRTLQVLYHSFYFNLMDHTLVQCQVSTDDPVYMHLLQFFRYLYHFFIYSVFSCSLQYSPSVVTSFPINIFFKSQESFTKQVLNFILTKANLAQVFSSIIQTTGSLSPVQQSLTHKKGSFLNFPSNNCLSIQCYEWRYLTKLFGVVIKVCRVFGLLIVTKGTSSTRTTMPVSCWIVCISQNS